MGVKYKDIWVGVVVFLISHFANAQYPGWENYTSGNCVTAIAVEGNKLWIGTTGGLVCMDTVTGSMTFYNHANSGLPANYIYALAIEGTTKWVGTYDGGLAQFDGTTWTVYNTGNSGLPSDYVRALAMEGSTKWVGTDGGGLASYTEQGAEEKSNVKYQKSKIEIVPNPVIHSTTIYYQLPTKCNVCLKLYDLSGREVRVLERGEKSAGSYELKFSGADLAGGVYFVSLSAGKYKETKKIVLVE